MRDFLWRQSRIYRADLVLIMILAIAAYSGTQTFSPGTKISPTYKTKMAAAELTLKGFFAIQSDLLAKERPISKFRDPTGIGLIGHKESPLTSKQGSLVAKQTTINPNWAAVFVHYFSEIGLAPGDRIAMSLTGSFPALNIAGVIAAEQFGLRPIIVSSVATSSFGANRIGFCWLDMEKLLFEAGIINTRSIAATMGAISDAGKGLDQRGRDLIDQAAERTGTPLMTGKTKAQMIAKRIAVYREQLPEIKAYINVGGNIASIGSLAAKRRLPPGMVNDKDAGEDTEDGVVGFFQSEGIPVVNFTNIKDLAHEFDLPIAPWSLPTVGEGSIYRENPPSRVLSGSAMAVIISLLWLSCRRRLRNLEREQAPTRLHRPQTILSRGS